MKTITKKLVLIGGGGHCKACIDVIEQQGKYHIAGIVDTEDKLGESIMGYKIIAKDDQIKDLTRKYDHFLVTLGQIKSPDKRMDLFSSLEKWKVNLAIVISPHAIVSRTAQIAKGSIIMHHALVNSDAAIGANCIVNSKALIEHGTHIEDHCHISTGAIVNGDATIKQGCFVGSGAIVYQGIQIGENSIISAGARVKHDVTAGTVWKEK